MHILFVTSELCGRGVASKGGGLASFVANMSSILWENGHDVEIMLVTTKENSHNYDLPVSVVNVFVPKIEWDEYNSITQMLFTDSIQDSDLYRKIAVDVRKSELVKQKIDELNSVKKIDIVHFANLGGYSLFMDYSIPYIVRISGFGNIIEEGAERPECNLDFSDNPIRKKDVIEVRALQRSKYTVSPSDICAEIARKSFAINPKVIESPYFDEKDICFDTYNKQLEGKRYFLFIGKLNRNKGVHIIAELSKKLLNKYDDMYLVLAGNDRDIEVDDKEVLGSEYVFSMAGAFRDRVIYLGQLSKDDLQGVISRAEAIILPSRIDNLPNTCIESMALGKVVIGTDGASFEQLIIDGENGFLCERDNVDSFFDTIERVISLTSKEKKIIEQKALKVIERLSPQRIYEQYIDYYNYVIKNWSNKGEINGNDAF